jgi:hypothetical protein
MMAGAVTRSRKEAVMRGLTTIGGLLAALGLAGGLTAARPAAQEKTYDLRGPAPTKGQTFQNKMTMRIKDADTTLKVMGQSLKVKATIDMTGEEEETVLAVDGRNVTKSQAKILKERADISMDFGGMNNAQTMPSELEGEVVISERIGEGKWKHSLVDTKPTDKQKKELDTRNGIENDDDLFPAEKVSVGHEWTVEAKALTKLFGNSFQDIKGEIKQKFVKVEMLDGEEVAVIESTGSVKGKMKDEDGEPSLDVEMTDLKLTGWRSLKTGVTLKEKFEGKFKMSGTQKVDDMKIEITLSGPFTGEGTTKLKAAK